MTQAARADVWAAGDSYEPYIGRWSRLVAPEFLAWTKVRGSKDWLDVGCGTGALTQAILDTMKPKSIVAVDPTPGYVEYARSHVRARDVSFRLANKATLSFRVADARSLPALGNSVDAVVSGLVLNFIPEPERAVFEMSRVVRRGGTVAAYVWDYAGRMELLRIFWDAAVALDASAAELDEGNRFPVCSPGELEKLFAAAELLDVETRPIDATLVYRDFDDLWTPFLGGQGPAPTYVASLERERRELLRDAVRESLPIRRDHSIRLTARAWAVKGRVA